MFSFLFPVYNRVNINIIDGEGALLYDDKGKKYIDFMAGIAVNSLGYKHPAITKVMTQMINKPIHLSNVFCIDSAEELARRFSELTFARHTFFANSGTEGIECAIKTARSYQQVKGNALKKNIISFSGAFHGRTMGALSICDPKKRKDNFAPFMPGVLSVEFNNIDALRNVIDEHTGAIFIEPIQGEGGIIEAKYDFLKEVRKICNDNDIVLCFDEIQCGASRAGKFLASEFYDVVPDICVMAKGIGGGFPISACLVNERVIEGMFHKMHGSTFGGNPLACSIALSVINTISDPEMLDAIRKKGNMMKEMFIEIKREFPDIIKEVRGKGLLIGLKLSDSISSESFARAMINKGLLVTSAGDNVIRITPPLIIDDEIIKEGINLFRLNIRSVL